MNWFLYLACGFGLLVTVACRQRLRHFADLQLQQGPGDHDYIVEESAWWLSTLAAGLATATCVVLLLV